MKIHVSRFMVEPGARVRLQERGADDTRPFASKREIDGRLEKDIERLFSLQERLYAEQRWSLLLVFQA